MILKYEDKKFKILDPTPGHLITLSVSKLWLKNYADNSFQTSDIKDAARFRKYADASAEKLFKRVMLRSYPFPSGGIIHPPELPPLEFQFKLGVPHLLSGNRKYLAHEPGLGKSAQFIMLVNSKPGQALIVCPSFLKTTWAREITKWSTNEFPSIAVVPDSTKAFEMNWGADFIIVSDSMISKLWVLQNLTKIKFRHVCIDEAHRFKTVGASRTVALFGGQIFEDNVFKVKSPGLIYGAEHVAFLSGTPMLNRPMELWPLLISAAPELIDFMPQYDFGFRYCNPTRGERGEWLFLGSHNEKELHDKIFGRFMQRLKKEDVLKDLPPKVREVILVSAGLDKEVLKLDDELKNKIDFGNLERQENLGAYAKLRHEIGFAKVEFCAKFVENLLIENPNESIILFAVHRDVVERLNFELGKYDPEIIYGGMTDEDRTMVQDKFQSKRCRLIIGNIEAMNLGLTLTAATRVVFCEYMWTPALNEQAEDRAHRIGQHDSVFCQYLVAADTIDEMVLNKILEKQERINAVIEGKN